VGIKANNGSDTPPSRDQHLPSAGKLKPNVAAVYIMAKTEAVAMGIPAYALPALKAEPTLEEARAAQEKVDAIVASYTSANI